MRRWRIVARPRPDRYYGAEVTIAATADAANDSLTERYLFRRNAARFARLLGKDSFLGDVLIFEVVKV